jgi:hypothetical protein
MAKTYFHGVLLRNSSGATAAKMDSAIKGESNLKEKQCRK